VKRADHPCTAVPSCLNGLFALERRNYKVTPHYDLVRDKRKQLTFQGESGELPTRGSSIICQIHFREELPTRDDQSLHSQVKLLVK
jgi:hypothetical protein